jgi:hypothetical protein
LMIVPQGQVRAGSITILNPSFEDPIAPLTGVDADTIPLVLSVTGIAHLLLPGAGSS